jgi:hypothetical protein
MQVEKALEEIKTNFLDEEGFIVQKDRDGGDSLNRLGHLYSLLFLLGRPEDLQGRPLAEGFRAQLAKVTVHPGLYRRHWDKQKWYYNENTTSRDQYTPVVIAAGLLGEKQINTDIIGYLKQNGSYPNTIPNGDPPGPPKAPDILLPGNAADLWRGGGDISGLSPFGQFALAELDCAQVYMSRFRALRQVGDGADSGSDDLNLTISLLYGLSQNPTENLYAAAYEYFNAEQKPIDRLRYYFRPSSGAPPLADVYKVAIEKVLQQHPLKPTSESDVCKAKVSQMMQVIADKAWKSLKICDGLKTKVGPVTIGIDKPFNQTVTGFDFDFTKDYAKLTINVEVTCQSGDSALIKTEVKAQGKIVAELNPSTCQVINATVSLEGKLLDLITIQKIERDVKDLVQNELNKVCSPQ